jgi:hypothetical protein
MMMRRDREFDDILNDCLEKMLQGRSIEQCLADYPDHASALEPMLRTAARTRMAANVRPRPEFKDRARHEFQVAIRDMETKPAPVGHRFFPGLKPVWIAVCALVAIIIAGGGTVYAAGNALPDSPLYSIKLATEQVRLFFTPSDIGKAELYAQFADERVEEIIRMADKGDVELVEKTTNRLNEQLVAIASLALGDGAVPAGDGMLALQAPEASKYGEGSAPTMAPPTTAVAPPVPVTIPSPEADTNAQLGAAGRSPIPATETAISAVSEGQDNEENGDQDRREKLKEQLLRQAIENPEALEEALKTAPESLRDLILWAIEVANKGYDEAINNIR